MSLRRGFQVFDTGENVDSETGEALTQVTQENKPDNYGDSETGEQTQLRLVYQRSKFRVPRSALKVRVFDTAVHEIPKKDSDSLFDLTLLILPVLMILPGWATILYALVEMLYHIWSHKHADTHTPLKTPLRMLFDAKCAECLSKKQMQRVGKLQDKRTLKINSRRILNYDYAQFGLGT